MTGLKRTLNRIPAGLLAAPLALALAFASGCTSSPAVTARAAVESELGSGGTATAAMCQQGTGESWIAIGAGTSDPISNGSSYQGDPVSVSCKVHPTAGNFLVTLSAELAGAGAISVIDATISSDTTQVSTGITGNFSKVVITGEFTENACTWDFGGQPSDLNQDETAGNPLGIAAGRIWGNLTCPMLVNMSENTTCFGQAELRFENCEE